MIRLANCKLDIDDDDFKGAVTRRLKMAEKDLLALQIVKKSVDARRGDIKFIYTFDIKTSADEAELVKRMKYAQLAPQQKKWSIQKGVSKLEKRPVIIGAGPAGLFSALLLSEHGYKPIILERGRKVEERDNDVESFFGGGGLKENSNICFGEGGAGTFSDGKLKTRISDQRCFYVMEALCEAGAPSSILYDAKPHVGTDILRVVISKLRKTIERNGGQFLFESKVSDIKISDGIVKSISVGDKSINTDIVILATGHSARDTYNMLREKGVMMEKKPFAMGLRIEHPREMIDKAMHHKYAGHKKLGAASYNLNVTVGDKKAYTFCMCPGGVVVNSSNELGALCVNGMSRHKRDGENSNSAIVCQVTPEMMKSESPLSGIEFQRKYERIAFELGGTDYGVPAMRVCDFLSGEKARSFEVMPTVKPRAVAVDLKNALPDVIRETIKLALPEMGKKIQGFDMGGAVLSAVESRTSSPVRILRDSDLQSVNVKGLYPAGEGAGYAGGIVSSAVDGLRAAEAIIEKFSANEIDGK